MKETTLEVGSNEKLSKLFGVFDENLNVLRAELGVEIRVKGTTLSIEGERAELCRTVLERLSALADAGETVDKTRLLYCVELAREGNDADIAKMMSGVVAITSRGKPVKCKTIGQKAYVDAIKNNTVVFGVGPAGTGKTYLAVALAVAAYKAKAVEKIILTRPAVEAGEKLGFLPGDLQTKVDPYLRPLYDALAEMFGMETYQKLMEKGAIEIAPLAYMARAYAERFVHHFRRSAEHHARTDEDVSHPHRGGKQGGRHGRSDADRPPGGEKERIDARDAYFKGHRRYRRGPPDRAGRRPSPAGHEDHPRLRPCGRKKD